MYNSTSFTPTTSNAGEYVRTTNVAGSVYYKVEKRDGVLCYSLAAVTSTPAKAQ